MRSGLEGPERIGYFSDGGAVLRARDPRSPETSLTATISVWTADAGVPKLLGRFQSAALIKRPSGQMGRTVFGLSGFAIVLQSGVCTAFSATCAFDGYNNKRRTKCTVIAKA